MQLCIWTPRKLERRQSAPLCSKPNLQTVHVPLLEIQSSYKLLCHTYLISTLCCQSALHNCLLYRKYKVVLFPMSLIDKAVRRTFCSDGWKSQNRHLNDWKDNSIIFLFGWSVGCCFFFTSLIFRMDFYSVLSSLTWLFHSPFTISCLLTLLNTRQNKFVCITLSKSQYLCIKSRVRSLLW